VFSSKGIMEKASRLTKPEGGHRAKVPYRLRPLVIEELPERGGSATVAMMKAQG
jgi:hypothetical protein